MQDQTLSFEVWTGRAAEHQARVSPYTEAFLERRSLGRTHAVHDFLFLYYTCSPQKLKQWVPSYKESLILQPECLESYPWLKENHFYVENGRLRIENNLFQGAIFKHATFIAHLCKNILERPSRYRCFGLHEWAMVYKQTEEELRHKKHCLRLSSEGLSNFVESQTLCCSHYDAYRFFTKEAKPLNLLQPDYDTRLDMEQGGCIHANMDLYKWATKLWPWIGSDFIAKTFFLALEGRELDMRASPYDLSAEGYSPICIETEEGRIQYQQEQLAYAAKAELLRQELLAFCEDLIPNVIDSKISF